MIPGWDGIYGDCIEDVSGKIIEKLRKVLNVSGFIIFGHHRVYDKNGQCESNFVLGIPELRITHTSNHDIRECIDRAISKFNRRHLKSVS